MVHSADRIPISEAMAAQNILATLLSYKLKLEYSEMCSFVKARMSLAILRSNIMVLCGPWKKAARIPQRPKLTDGAVMTLLVPCWD